MYYVISIDAHIIACIWIYIYIYNIHCIPQEHGYNPVFTNISFLRALRLRQGTVTSQRRSESLRDNLNKKKTQTGEAFFKGWRKFEKLQTCQFTTIVE